MDLCTIFFLLITKTNNATFAVIKRCNLPLKLQAIFLFLLVILQQERFLLETCLNVAYL